MGAKSREKDIVLNVANLLADNIRAHYPGIEVIMTRHDDTFIPLGERAQLANRAGADLFISIHANIARNKKAFGTETWVMGPKSTAYNLAVAKRENAVIKYETDYATRYEWDPNSAEGTRLLHQAQHEYLDRSITFAKLVEESFEASGRHSRGVKRNDFVVLKCTAMPSVLVELGFMSNRKEEKYLLSQHGQLSLANALFTAFQTYHETVGGGSTEAAPALAVAPEVSDIPKEPKEEIARVEAPTVRTTVLVVPEQPAANRSAGEAYYPSSFGVSITPTAAAPAPSVEQTTALANITSDMAKPATAPTVMKLPTRVSIGLQIAATKAPKNYAEQGWDKLGYHVREFYDTEYYRYQVRGFTNADEVMEAKADLTRRGVETIVVVYEGDRRLLGSEMASTLAAK